MKTIVVGSDGSPATVGAVQAAADLAADTGAKVHLVVACPVPVAVALDAVAVPSHHEVRAASGHALEGHAEQVRRRGIETEIHVCDGSAATVLCDVAEAVDADIIVVGDRRLQGAGRFLGSVASRVAHHAPCSVFIAKTCD